MHEKTLSTETVYSGLVVNVDRLNVELETGQHAVREIVRHHGAVAILARLPDEQFVFIRQYRKATEKIMLEVVAGVLEAGEDSRSTALRELKEETGFEALDIDKIGSIFPSPGYLDEQIDVFFAMLPAVAGARDLDHDERVEVVVMSGREFTDRIRRGEVEDAKTLAAWALYRSCILLE
jgi:ADP-ribose pyrophosphatase